jgi:hypothetical protein
MFWMRYNNRFSIYIYKIEFYKVFYQSLNKYWLVVKTWVQKQLIQKYSYYLSVKNLRNSQTLEIFWSKPEIIFMKTQLW